jgi:hypothetical protein
MFEAMLYNHSHFFSHVLDIRNPDISWANSVRFQVMYLIRSTMFSWKMMVYRIALSSGHVVDTVLHVKSVCTAQIPPKVTYLPTKNKKRVLMNNRYILYIV